MPYKIKRAEQFIFAMEKNKTTVFMGPYHNNVREDMKTFRKEEWKASYGPNADLNNEITLKLADIRPFGNWYENKFGNIVTNYASLYGILCISRKHILQHPKQHYINIIKDVETSSNPEAGHYLERSWEAVFHPITGATIIKEDS